MPDPLFDPWCADEATSDKGNSLHFLEEKVDAQAKAVKILQELVPKHYWDPDVVQKWLHKWGYSKALNVVKKDLPEGKISRSGDIGEILATEYVNRKLGFEVPIFRLRWRDHRELALRGDDLFAVRLDDQGRVHFLKGEAKSRQSLSLGVLNEAKDALQTHDGRPGPHTINYVVKRLSELGRDDLYEALEDYLTRRTIPRQRVTHLLFALCGNDPKPHLASYFSSYAGTIQHILVGFRVKNHGAFVKTVFDGVKLA